MLLTRKTEAHPGAAYGCWSHDPKALGNRPRCLHLFSGPSREGDLASHLNSFGWATCSVDTVQPVPTDVLDGKVKAAILEDVTAGEFDFVWMGTPCSTFSTLRNEPGGPRPLRAPGAVQGLPDAELKPWERRKLAEGQQANVFVDLSADIMEACMGEGRDVPFTLENPEPQTEVTIFNMPRILAIAKRSHPGLGEVCFDQCRFGCEATKPTRLMCFLVRYPSLSGKRCDHLLKRFLDENKKPYDAKRRKVAGQKVVGADGKEEWASKRLAEYPAPLCKEIAEQVIRVARERAKAAVDLARGDAL